MWKSIDLYPVNYSNSVQNQTNLINCVVVSGPEEGNCFWSGREEPHLPGLGQNSSAQEDHSLLWAVLVLGLPFKLLLVLCCTGFTAGFTFTWLLYLQVCCFLPLLWNQFQDLRIWRQHLPHSVHIWCYWSSSQNPHIFYLGYNWPSEWPGMVSDDNRSADWNKHGHTFRLIYFLYIFVKIYLINACK